MKKILLLIPVLFSLSSNALAQTGICLGDLNCDGEVGGLDTILFKAEYPRSPYLNEPCPEYNPRCISAPVPKTGQTTCYDSPGTERSCTGTGEDGEYQKGVEWPNPRFTIIYCNTNGQCSDQGSDCDADADTDVVTDNLTGLMWTRDASMFGMRTWQDALNDCNNLYFAGYDDWRLPNRLELESLLNLKYYNPALPNTAGTVQWSEGDPFANQLSSAYWSSTTYAGNPPNAWVVYFYYGNVGHYLKSGYYYVRAVRGGQ